MVNTDVVIKQKRGRKPKSATVKVSEENLEDQVNNNIIFSIEETKDDNNNDANTILSNQEEESKPIGGKKRGRKPKGGKIIQQIVPLNNNTETKPNVILHLKCSLKELQTNVSLSSNIESFNFSTKNDLKYEIITSNQNVFSNSNNYSTNNYSTNNYSSNNYSTNNYSNANNSNNINTNDDSEIYDDECYSKNKENDIREIWKKLKQLQHNLHINNISNKKSACFWCTCDFDNPPVYIPKHFINGSYHVYGCFCSPECATAHLMEENIDSSSKFERYHLINNIYTKIYDYKKNIKPAPNPFYLLDKYYCNLSIQEFRSLLRNERLFLVVDKPLTRILPELHEDNDDFIINNKIIPANTLLIKKKLQKKSQTKNNILSEKFGLAQ